MVERKTVPAYGNCGIKLAAEQMNDGKWAVAVTVVQSTDTAQRNTDLPITDARFDTETEAEEHGIRMAQEWIDRNMPKNAAGVI
jgi:hypothetical protein